MQVAFKKCSHSCRSRKIKTRHQTEEGRFKPTSLRHRVFFSQYRALELPNNARQRRLSHAGGSGETQFPQCDWQFAAKISVGKFGATVWVGSDGASSLIGKSGETIRSGQGLRES